MTNRDAGSGLIEAIVGISLLGIVLTGVVDAVWTNVAASTETRRRSTAIESVLEVDRVLRLSDYSPCPHIDGSYLDDIANSGAFSAGSSAAITRYEYWNRPSSTWIDFGNLIQAECALLDDLTDPMSIQRLTVRITDERGSSWVEKFIKSHGPAI